MHPLKTDRYSGVVHCGLRRPRESRLATAVRGRPPEPCTDPGGRPRRPRDRHARRRTARTPHRAAVATGSSYCDGPGLLRAASPGVLVSASTFRSSPILNRAARII